MGTSSGRPGCCSASESHLNEFNFFRYDSKLTCHEVKFNPRRTGGLRECVLSRHFGDCARCREAHSRMFSRTRGSHGSLCLHSIFHLCMVESSLLRLVRRRVPWAIIELASYITTEINLCRRSSKNTDWYQAKWTFGATTNYT